MVNYYAVDGFPLRLQKFCPSDFLCQILFAPP
jgi:hypothetical protein